MKKISENEYKKAEERIEELLLLIDDNTPKEDPNFIFERCYRTSHV